MDLELSGKCGIVTGASRGIGRATAQRLSAEGMKLLVASRSREELETLAASLPAGAVVHVADLREPTAPGAMITAAMREFGAIDLLVNCAGATRRGDFLTLSEDDWTDGFALKFFAAMRASREAWPWLQKSVGAIINIVGMGGRTGSADFAIGGAVNAALLNLTKVLADRGVRDGVRVNAINPGSIATQRLRDRVAQVAAEQGIDEAAAARQMTQKLGVLRFGQPEEIANAVAFLASPAAAYCHGTILDVDGGQTRTL